MERRALVSITFQAVRLRMYLARHKDCAAPMSSRRKARVGHNLDGAKEIPNLIVFGGGLGYLM